MKPKQHERVILRKIQAALGTKAKNETLVALITSMQQENQRAKKALKYKALVDRTALDLTANLNQRIRRAIDAEIGAWRTAVAELTIAINALKEEIRQDG